MTAGWPSISSFRRRATSCRLPGLDPVRAAPLTDAALTSYHAVKLSLPQLHPQSTAVVLGVGGLGHMAVQILKAITPARIVAVDVRDAALELARAAGADLTLSADGLTAEDIRAETDPDGVAVVIDFVGSGATLALAAGSVAQGGDVTFLGRGGGELRVAPGLIPYETTVRMPTWGTIAELAEVVALAAAGKIHSEAQVYRPRRRRERLRQAPARRGARARGRRPGPANARSARATPVRLN